jgi:hypothetical protein
VTPEASPRGTPPWRSHQPLPLARRPRPESDLAPPPPATTPPSMAQPATAEPVVIDCDRCSMRGIGCGDCMVTVLLGGPPYGVALDDAEQAAISALADAGLIPPLRMVDPVDSIHVVPE